MPIIKSAKKRVRQAKKAAVRNSKTRRALREALKSLQASLETKDSKKLTEAQKNAQSALDTAVKRGLIHKNKAARQKKQLAARAKAAGAKVSKTPVKPAVKKSVSKAKRSSSAKSAA